MKKTNLHMKKICFIIVPEFHPELEIRERLALVLRVRHTKTSLIYIPIAYAIT